MGCFTVGQPRCLAGDYLTCFEIVRQTVDPSEFGGIAEVKLLALLFPMLQQLHPPSMPYGQLLVNSNRYMHKPSPLTKAAAAPTQHAVRSVARE